MYWQRFKTGKVCMLAANPVPQWFTVCSGITGGIQPVPCSSWGGLLSIEMRPYAGPYNAMYMYATPLEVS